MASYHSIVAVPFGAVGVRLNQAQTHVQSLEYLPPNMSERAPETALAFLQESFHSIACLH